MGYSEWRWPPEYLKCFQFNSQVIVAANYFVHVCVCSFSPNRITPSCIFEYKALQCYDLSTRNTLKPS